MDCIVNLIHSVVRVCENETAAAFLGLRLPDRSGTLHRSGHLWRRAFMSYLLQRLSVRACSAFRRLLSRAAAGIESRPRLAAWFYPRAGRSTDADYRDYNGRMFAGF